MGIKLNSSERNFQLCLDKIVDDDMGIDVLRALDPGKIKSLASELEAAAWLRGQLADVEPPPGFVAASKRRLLTRIAEGEVTKRTPFWMFGQRLIWKDVRVGNLRTVSQWALVFVLIAATIFNISRLGRAAQTWLPGDHLYALKSTREAVELGLARGEVAQGRLHIRLARLRLLEVQALVFENRYEEIPLTVAEFGQHVDSSIQAIEQVAWDDPYTARLLMGELQNALSSQTDFVTLLAGFAPHNTQLEIQRAVATSKASLSKAEDALAPGNGRIVPQKISLQNCWEKTDQIQ